MKKYLSTLTFAITLLLLGGSIFGVNTVAKADRTSHKPTAIQTSATASNYVEEKDWRANESSSFTQSNQLNENNCTGNSAIPNEYLCDKMQPTLQNTLSSGSVNAELQKTLMGGTAQSTMQTSARVNLYGMLTPELIKFYEENIAKDNFISSIRATKLERMAKKLNIPTQKLIAVLIMQDIASKSGATLDMKNLAVLSDAEMFKLGTQYVKAYIATLSEADRETLKIKFQQLNKK